MPQRHLLKETWKEYQPIFHKSMKLKIVLLFFSKLIIGRKGNSVSTAEADQGPSGAPFPSDEQGKKCSVCLQTRMDH